MRREGHLRVGKPDTRFDKPSHVRGVREGNETGSFEKQDGLIQEQDMARGTARRSTGINPDREDPIDDDMPNLSPA
jgi:hypothetical protein